MDSKRRRHTLFVPGVVVKNTPHCVDTGHGGGATVDGGRGKWNYNSVTWVDLKSQHSEKVLTNIASWDSGFAPQLLNLPRSVSSKCLSKFKVRGPRGQDVKVSGRAGGDGRVRKALVRAQMAPELIFTTGDGSFVNCRTTKHSGHQIKRTTCSFGEIRTETCASIVCSSEPVI